MQKKEGYQFGMKHEFLLLGFGGMIAIFIYTIFPITYFPDSDQYYNFGKTILGETNSNTSNFRGIGLPLIFIVSGVYLLGTFKVFVFLQLLIGVIIPLILYKLLSYWNKRYAFFVSTLAAISLVSFGYAKAILSEQAYMFVLLLLIYNSIKLQQTLKIRYLYFQALLIFLLVIIKPLSNLLFIIFLPHNIFLFRKRLKHVGFSFMLLFALVFISIQYSNHLFKNAPDYQKRQQMAGSILFYNLYLSSDIEGRSCDLNRIKSFRKLLDEIVLFYLTHPNEYSANLDKYKDNPEAFKFIFKPYLNNPVALSHAIVDKPNKYYYSFIYENANLILGNERGDRMMLKASEEMILEFPSLALGYSTRNLFAFASGKYLSYSYYIARGKRITEYFPPSMEPLTWAINANPESGMASAMAEELGTGKVNQVAKFVKIRDFLLVEVWGRIFLILRPIIFLCMLLGIFLLYKEKYYPQILLCSSIVLYHMLIICIFNIPLNRYLIPTLMLELFCAAVFIYVIQKNIL